MEPTHHDVHVPPRSSARGAGDARRGRSQVRAIARAAGRTCSRPGCETPAAATLVFSYGEQVARLVDLLEEAEPQAYDLCPAHADRTRPPVGWELSDTRPPPSDGPRRLDNDQTVAVLAAALRGEAPPTRVSVVEGGRADELPATDATDAHDADAEAAGAAGAAGATGATRSRADGRAVAPSDEEDPLRAALEELQRIALPDDDVTGAGPASPATPLRRGAATDALASDESVHDEPVDGAPGDDAPARAVWQEVVSAREAAGQAAGSQDTAGQGDNPTLW